MRLVEGVDWGHGDGNSYSVSIDALGRQVGAPMGQKQVTYTVVR